MKTIQKFLRNNKLRKIIAIILLFSPILFYFYNLLKYSVNIPYNDDYDTVLGFMNNFTDSHSLKTQFDSIVGFWNDHRQPFNKIITILLYYISGSINLKVMMIIGNIALIIIIWIFYRFFNNNQNKPLYFLPAVILFFQPAYAENSYFAMASLTNFYVMAFGFISILLIQRKDHNLKEFIFAVAFAVCAFYTQKNGVLFLLLGFLLLLYQKNWKKSIIWLIVFICSYLFYTNYGTARTITTAINPSHWFTLPSFNLTYFLNFIGNNFGASFVGYNYGSGSKVIQMISSILPLAVGVMTCAYFVFLTIVRYYKKNAGIYAIFLFLILSAVGAAMVRAHDLGLAQAITSRYRVVTIQFIILAYLSLIELIQNNEKWRKIIFGTAVIFAICFSVLSYKLKYYPVLKHREDLITALNNWKATGKGLNPLSHPNPYANEIMKISVEKKIYKVPEIKN